MHCSFHFIIVAAVAVAVAVVAAVAALTAVAAVSESSITIVVICWHERGDCSGFERGYLCLVMSVLAPCDGEGVARLQLAYKTTSSSVVVVVIVVVE